MFDIGFGELVVFFIVGLIVLGPEKLPIAVKTVAGWIKAIRTIASNVQNELTQELKWQELQESLDKVEQESKKICSDELGSSVEELRKSAEAIKQTYHISSSEIEQEDDIANINEKVVYQDVQEETKQGDILLATSTTIHEKEE